MEDDGRARGVTLPPAFLALLLLGAVVIGMLLAYTHPLSERL